MSLSPPLTTEAGQRQWVVSVLAEYEARLTRYAQRLTHDPDLARDVVQHAFLRLCSLEPGAVDNVGQWLYAVCRNRAVDILRKENRMHALEDGEAYAGREPSPDSAAETRDSLSLVRRILTSLPAAQQEVVDLWADGFSYPEIARITQRTEINVRVIVHRAFKAIREHPLARQLGEAAP